MSTCIFRCCPPAYSVAGDRVQGRVPRAAPGDPGLLGRVLRAEHRAKAQIPALPHGHGPSPTAGHEGGQDGHPASRCGADARRAHLLQPAGPAQPGGPGQTQGPPAVGHRTVAGLQSGLVFLASFRVRKEPVNIVLQLFEALKALTVVGEPSENGKVWRNRRKSRICLRSQRKSIILEQLPEEMMERIR